MKCDKSMPLYSKDDNCNGCVSDSMTCQNCQDIMKERIIVSLTDDYYDYLQDLTLEQLNLILKELVFTYREAKILNEKEI